MAKTKPQQKLQILRWSDHIASSEVQDPLGLGLRGSTRLASLLLQLRSFSENMSYTSSNPIDTSVTQWCLGFSIHATCGIL